MTKPLFSPPADLDPCQRLLIEAVKLYAQDASGFYRGLADTYDLDRLGAWHDLHGPREQLARLCRPLGLCPVALGDRIAARIFAGDRFSRC